MIHLDINKNAFIDDMYYDKDDLINLIRLQKQLFLEENILATIEECINIWQKYSWSFSASWMDFPKDDAFILSRIKSSYDFDNFENYSKL